MIELTESIFHDSPESPSLDQFLRHYLLAIEIGSKIIILIFLSTTNRNA